MIIYGGSVNRALGQSSDFIAASRYLFPDQSAVFYNKPVIHLLNPIYRASRDQSKYIKKYIVRRNNYQ